MPSSLVHILAALLVLGVLVLLSVSAVLQPVLDWGRVGVEFLSQPLLSLLERVNNFFLLVLQLKDLGAQNQILDRQVEKLTAEVAALEKAKEENRFLREALGFQIESRLSLIAAEVVGLDPLGADQKVTLNRGRNHGVAEGAPVVAGGPTLVGVITAVFDHTSQMDLLTSSGAAVNAEVVPGGATGIVRGEHGLGLTFDLVSQTEVIKPGDKVLTSGLGGRFPKNLLIGEIGKIRSSESELFQKASIIPGTNLRSLRVVFVVQQ